VPHYSTGDEAKVGDVVRGKPYNTEHEVIGVVTGITPGSDACNLRVAFARRPKAYGTGPMLAFPDSSPNAPADAIVPVACVVDYGATGDFTLVHRGA